MLTATGAVKEVEWEETADNKQNNKNSVRSNRVRYENIWDIGLKRRGNSFTGSGISLVNSDKQNINASK